MDDTKPDVVFKNDKPREYVLSNKQFRIIEDVLDDRIGYLICENLNYKEFIYFLEPYFLL